MRFALTAAVVVSPARAVERPPAALHRRRLHANEDCHGGSGDSADTTACEDRSTIDRKMSAAGRCYGRPGDDGAPMDWHRCKR